MNGYLSEFFFRFNRRNFLKTILHKLIERFMTNVPSLYKANAAYMDNPKNLIKKQAITLQQLF